MTDDEFTRRAALARFAVVTTAGWLGVSAPRAAALGSRHAATLRALGETYGVRDPVRALHRMVDRRGDRFRDWATLVLDALEHAPARGHFSHLTPAQRQAELRAWWTLPDATDRLLFVPRAADALAPQGLAAANAHALKRIHAQQANAAYRPPRPHVPGATGGPLDSDVQRLRHLRGSAADLATILRKAR
ncbi:MAG: hypothetical protein QOF76_1127 [Solirubrobacteraceae bacterium]|nr:hypothetical protein [Solirubrobacteraceae bacterium]